LVLDQLFEGELPVPGAAPRRKAAEPQTVITPQAATVAGAPPFDLS
jgi:hypothetical protein